MNLSLTYSALIYLRGRGEQVIGTDDRLALLNSIFHSWIVNIRSHRSL